MRQAPATPGRSSGDRPTVNPVSTRLRRLRDQWTLDRPTPRTFAALHRQRLGQEPRSRRRREDQSPLNENSCPSARPPLRLRRMKRRRRAGTLTEPSSPQTDSTAAVPTAPASIKRGGSRQSVAWTCALKELVCLFWPGSVTKKFSNAGPCALPLGAPPGDRSSTFPMHTRSPGSAASCGWCGRGRWRSGVAIGAPRSDSNRRCTREQTETERGGRVAWHRTRAALSAGRSW